VTTLENLKGLKLRSTGGAQDLTMRNLGAIPVRMAAPDTYESLSRGTLDGVVFPLDSVVSYNVEKLVKYSTEGANFSSFIVAYSISDAVWNQLTPEVRKIMIEAGEETGEGGLRGGRSAGCGNQAEDPGCGREVPAAYASLHGPAYGPTQGRRQ